MPASPRPPRAQLSGRRAFIKYERDDNCFWFNPVVDEHRPSSSTPGFPCNRGDIFLKLGTQHASLGLGLARRGRQAATRERPGPSPSTVSSPAPAPRPHPGMRGARLIPWRLREGDVFRLGQAYVLVAKVVPLVGEGSRSDDIGVHILRRGVTSRKLGHFSPFICHLSPCCTT